MKIKSMGRWQQDLFFENISKEELIEYHKQKIKGWAIACLVLYLLCVSLVFIAVYNEYQSEKICTNEINEYKMNLMDLSKYICKQSNDVYYNTEILKSGKYKIMCYNKTIIFRRDLNGLE